jgi:hypothetical protein
MGMGCSDPVIARRYRIRRRTILPEPSEPRHNSLECARQATHGVERKAAAMVSNIFSESPLGKTQRVTANDCHSSWAYNPIGTIV